MGGELPLAAKSVPGRNDDLGGIVTLRSRGVNGKQGLSDEEIFEAVENEAVTNRCNVARNYIEDSESSGARVQFRLQGFISALKALPLKKNPTTLRGSGLRRRRLCRFAGSD